MTADTANAASPALGHYAMTMLVCSDVAASRDFYRETFGLRVTVDSPDWVELELLPGLSLALHPRDAEHHLDVAPGSTFMTFRVDDADEFVASAAARGTRIAMAPQDEPFGRLAIALDPDGYSWQIFTPKG